MNSELALWPRRFCAAIVIAWACMLLVKGVAGWDAFLLSALLGVAVGALSVIGALVAIGFLVAAIAQRDRPGILWSFVLLILAGVPIAATLAGF